MLTYDFAVQDELPSAGHGGAAGYPADIILVGDEANFHAVGLVRRGEAKLLGQRARLRFFEGAERQCHARGLLARQAAEHIALVIRRHALKERAVFRAGIVPGRDKLRTDTVGDGDKRFELDAGVADDAGVRRLTAQVHLGKRAADVLLKLTLDVDDRQSYPHALRGGHGVKPSALLRVIEVHTVHLMPRPLQQHGRHGGVDPAGKT